MISIYFIYLFMIMVLIMFPIETVCILTFA